MSIISSISAIQSQIKSNQILFNRQQRQLQDQISQLRLQLQSTKHSSSSQLQVVRRAISNSDTQITNHQNSQISRLRNQVSSLQDQLQFLHTQNSSQNRDIEAHLKVLRQQNNLLLDKVDRLSHEKRGVQQNIYHLTQKEILQKEAQIQQMKSKQVLQLAEVNTRVSIEIEELKSKQREAQNQLQALSNTHLNLVHQIKFTQQQSFTRIQNLKEELKNYQNEIQYLEANKKMLVNQQAQSRSASMQYIDMATDLEADLSKAVEHNQQMKTIADKLEKMIYGKSRTQKKSGKKSVKKSPSKKKF